MADNGDSDDSNGKIIEEFRANGGRVGGRVSGPFQVPVVVLDPVK